MLTQMSPNLCPLFHILSKHETWFNVGILFLCVLFCLSSTILSLFFVFLLRMATTMGENIWTQKMTNDFNINISSISEAAEIDESQTDTWLFPKY